MNFQIVGKKLGAPTTYFGRISISERGKSHIVSVEHREMFGLTYILFTVSG